MKRESVLYGVLALSALFLIVSLFFVGSGIGQVVVGGLFIGVITFLLLEWKKGKVSFGNWFLRRRTEWYSQSPESNMKTLLFDDLQSSAGGKYVVKEVDGFEKKVLPSSKLGQPIPVIGKEDRKKDFDASDFFDLGSDIFQGGTEPKGEFHFLLSKLLVALKSVVFGHTATFFWSNHEKQQLVLEAKETDSPNFTNEKRFSIDRDIVSEVAKSGKPQILGRAKAGSETELIRYYKCGEQIKSCVAVPVFYSTGNSIQQPVGVIAVDSKAEDAFGEETLILLGNFTKLVSGLIKSYTDKYDLLLDSELLSSIRRMQDQMKSNATETAILDSLVEEASKLINWEFLTITMFADEKSGWVIQKVMNRGGKVYPAEDQTIDFNNSIVGAVIKSNRLEHVQDLSLQDSVRFFAGETFEAKGSFLAVPISSINRCYGALTIESGTVGNFAGNEVEVVYRLVENAAASLEVLYMNDLVKDYVIVDHVTGSYTNKHFMKALDEEIRRAEDYGTDLSLVSIAIDGTEDNLARYGKEGFDSIMNQVAKIIRTPLRSYDAMGRNGFDRLDVLLVNTPASDGYLWAERLRKQIASHIVAVDGKSFSVTVSCGVSGISEGMERDTLVAGTNQVLLKAIESGGNLVRIY